MFGSTGSGVDHDCTVRGVALVPQWSPVRAWLFTGKFLVVRGWMVGEKKKAGEEGAAMGLLRVSIRLGLQVLGLGLASVWEAFA
jgi:hypothetical protein